MPSFFIQLTITRQTSQSCFTVNLSLSIPFIVSFEIIFDTQYALSDLFQLLTDHLQESIKQSILDALRISFMKIIEIVRDIIMLGKILLINSYAWLIKEVLFIDFEDSIQYIFDYLQNPKIIKIQSSLTFLMCWFQLYYQTRSSITNQISSPYRFDL